MGKVYDIAPRVEFEALNTGDYVLRLLEYKEVVEDHDTAFSKKGDVRLQFQWEVDVPGAEPTERRDWASIPKTFAAKSKFVMIALALGIVDESVAATAGAQIDFDDGLGKRCMGTIVRKIKEGTKEWTDQITAYTALTRIPGPRDRQRVQPAPPPINDDDIPF
jgi:hypothetical protein